MTEDNVGDAERRRRTAVLAGDRAVEKLERWVDRGSRRTSMDVVVEISTAVPLMKYRAAVEERLQLVPAALPRLRSVAVEFGIAEHLDEIVVAVRERRAAQAGAADGPAAGDGPAVSAVLELTLNELSWPMELEIGASAVPLLRRVDDGDRHRFPTALWLPPQFSVVPRGHLLDLVADGDRAALLRTEEREDVNVTLDGISLRAGRPQALRRQGTLRFSGFDRSDGTVVEYRVLPPGGGTDEAAAASADPSPMTVTMMAGTREVTIEVRPPALDQPTTVRQFPATPGQVMDQADHLLTWGVTVTTGERWHVKLYRCETPQHAARLRTYLRGQASLIDLVNRDSRKDAHGGAVVAPVFVAPAATDLDAAPVQTGLRSGGAIRADIETGLGGRLPGWFGHRLQPQVDSYVVVVSPWHDPVRWAPNTARPALEQLDLLHSVARAIDGFAARKTVHGDVKPENVCRSESGYLLVDGDSVTAATDPGALRPTWRYTSRAVQAAVRAAQEARIPVDSRVTQPVRVSGPANPDLGATPVATDLTEHDLFGFALVVITALAGEGPTKALVELQDGTRRIDDPEQVDALLWQAWPNGHGELIAQLTLPFRERRLRGSGTAADWLRAVEDAAERDRAGDVGGGHPDETALPADTPVGRIRAHVLATPLPVLQRPGRAVDLLREAALDQARAAETRAFLVWTIVPIFVAVMLLVAAFLRG